MGSVNNPKSSWCSHEQTETHGFWWTLIKANVGAFLSIPQMPQNDMDRQLGSIYLMRKKRIRYTSKFFSAFEVVRTARRLVLLPS